MIGKNKYELRCFSKEKAGFVVHVVRSRWFTIFASVLIMSVNGGTYLFGAYSDTIKSSLGYDQTTLNLLSFSKDLGGNLGIISGLINELAPPWAVLAIGAAMNLSGYLMVWAAVAGRVARPRVWQMCVYIWVGSDSQAFAGTGSLITCVKNFPESRGIVLGLLKGFVGLSGALITQIYHALHGNDATSLILLLAWLPAAVSFVFLPTLRIIKASRRRDDVGVFYEILYLSLALAAFLMVVIVVQSRIGFGRAEYVATASVVLILLFVPLAIISRQEFKEWKTAPVVGNAVRVEQPPPAPNSTSPNQEPERMSPVSDPPGSTRSSVSCIRNAPARGEDYTIPQALLSADMAILFIATSCGMGGTLTAIDNLGQIAKSSGYHANTITTFVSLISIWNYLGRVAAGFASEILLTRHKWPRPLLLALVLLLSCAGHLLIAFPAPNSLYAASVIIGFCFGAQNPLIFAIISEIFGLKYYSTLFQIGAAASPVGAYVLNVRVAGRLYDREAVKQMKARGVVRKVGEGLDCVGRECYKVAFVIIAAVTFGGCLVSLVLVVRTWAFYRGDIYRRFREDVKDGEAAASSGTNARDFI